MKKFIYIIIGLCSVLWANAQNNTLSIDKPLIFEYRDFINLKTYDWPETLLSYPVRFSGRVSEDNLVLINELTGEEELFQLSEVEKENGKLQFANVNFIAKLPVGGTYRYKLLANRKEKSASSNGLSIIQVDRGIEINSDKLKIRIPESAKINANTAPAPILGLNMDKDWIGNNKIKSPQKKILSIETKLIEKGCLFVCYAIHYKFESGSSYTAKVKIVKDYPFVILDETMHQIFKADSVSMDMAWDNFYPSKRYGTVWGRLPNKDSKWLDIDKPVYVNYVQEDPHWVGLGITENPSEEMVFRLAPYGGNSVREQPPIMSFWEEKENPKELGVFVYDHNKWNDKQYGVWQPTPDLSVYFKYVNNKLHFTYPLLSGTRSTAISLFDAKKGQEKVDAYKREITPLISSLRRANDIDGYIFRYSQMLHQQYASLSLNRVKDWELSYPEELKHPDNPFVYNEDKRKADDFYRQILASPLIVYPIGLNFFAGVHSIEHRGVYARFIKGYLTHYKNLSKQQRQTVEALFLMSGYVNTLEEMNPMRTSIAGTPNMAADGWCVPAQMSFLFPEHPMAKEWMDYFEKSLELYGLFYTRPEVKSFESLGGRWTESPATYNWAYFRPTTHSNVVSELFDRKNRFANKYMTGRGHWMVDIMTAPIYKYSGVGGKDKSGADVLEQMKKPARYFTPHGAHGGGVAFKRPASMTMFGNWMENYDPILAENIYWTGEGGEEFEKREEHANWLAVHKTNHDFEKSGTNPHLKSVKYTGHGIVLRAGVDTPEEMSVHLDQIDKGPNYRWGNQGQGNSGGIYFYAKGKIYTGHENELSGDHVANNLDGVTNFGVMKNGEFRTIGMNELTSPLFDLGIAQFAELTSAKGKDKYSWPEYMSRSIMLVGTDYFIIYDEVGTSGRANNRFSWFIPKDAEFPKIQFLSGRARGDHWMTAQTRNSKGFYRDANGSVLTLVTHKKDQVSAEGGSFNHIPLLETSDVQEFVSNRKLNYPTGVVEVKAQQSNDLIFRDRDEINYSGTNTAFRGKAGVVRRFNNGDLQLAIFKGEAISADGLSLKLKAPSYAALAVTRKPDGYIGGEFKVKEESSLIIEGLQKGGVLYVDGEKAEVRLIDAGTEVILPSGIHVFEYTFTDATPGPSAIISTEYLNKGVNVFIQKPESVKNCRIEVSYDGGQEWIEREKTDSEVYHLPYEDVTKIHVRAVSVNGKKDAEFAQEYPVYFTKEAPHYPEGLWLYLRKNSVELAWGNVLGVGKYKLYKRKRGEKKFQLIYEGKENSYTDNKATGVIPAYKFPGSLHNKLADNKVLTVYEYAISSSNGNGEGKLSPIENTDPASWKNWNPETELKFKRQSSFWLPPYVHKNMVPEKYYPE